MSFDYIEIEDGEENSDDERQETERILPDGKTFNTEFEYDPYHDMMQTFLFDLLKEGKTDAVV